MMWEREAIKRIAIRGRIASEKFVSSRESVHPRMASNETTTCRGSAIKCRKAQKESCGFIKSKPSNNQTNVQDLMGICLLISLRNKRAGGMPRWELELVFDGLDSRKAIGPDRRISPIGADCCFFFRISSTFQRGRRLARRAI